VDCEFNVYVLWMLYGLSFYVVIILLMNLMLFLHFFKKFFALKLLIFGGLPCSPKIGRGFSAGVNFRRPGGGPPKVDYFRWLPDSLFSEAFFLATENKLISAAGLWLTKI
jgi:hypothetical protein